MAYEPFDSKTAPPEDRVAWALCQIIDDDAPLRWTRYRLVAACLAANRDAMEALMTLTRRPK